MLNLTLDPDFFVCCICQIEYDQADRVPRMLPVCGHTFCSNCLERLVENQNQLRCPLDQIFYPIQEDNLHQVPVNIVLKQMVEQRAKIKNDLCEIHEGELKNLVCLDDKCRVCKYCVDYGNHKTHHIKYIKDIQVDAESKKRELEGLLGEFDRYSTAMNELLRKDKEIAAKIVRERFNTLKTALNKQEQELLVRVNSLYEQRRHKRHNTEAVREHTQFKKDIEQKIASLKELKMDNDFFTALEEPKFKSPARAEYEGLAKLSQDFQFNLEEALDDYHTGVISKMLESKNVRVEFKQHQALVPVNEENINWNNAFKTFSFGPVKAASQPAKIELKNPFKAALSQQMPRKTLAELLSNIPNFSTQPLRTASIKAIPNNYNMYQNEEFPISLQSPVPLGIQFHHQVNNLVLDLEEGESEVARSYESPVVESREMSENQADESEMMFEDQEGQELSEGRDEGEREIADEIGDKSPISGGSWFM